MDSFLQTFSEYIQPSDILILAVSGGVDSMVLLDLVKKNHPKENIIVAHLDHSLRGDQSDGDRELVASICDSDNITFEVQKIDIARLANEEKMSLEAMARRERYNFLENIRQKYTAKYILTAHHRDDQGETILMNLIKGGKVRGLSGMQVISGSVMRPLLNIAKIDIMDYAHRNNIHYREDKSNQDTQYERNHIRHDVIPELRLMNPQISETLSELGVYMQELAGFLGGYIQQRLRDMEHISGKENTFLIGDFVSLEPFIQREIISHLYIVAHTGSSHGLSRGAIDECIRFITQASNSHGTKEIKKLRLERRGERVYY